jgi:hypothetical protein
MSMYDFVLIRLTDFELEAQTRILDQISSQIWPLTLLVGVHFWKFSKTPLQASSYGQVASLCQFLSISDQPNPNDKPKHDFGSKIGQILNFDLSMRGQISKFEKNAVTGLFLGSSCFTVPIFVHIGPAESERQAKTWFWAKIRSNFELWPLRARSN